MQKFQYTFSQNGTVTGAQSIPPSSASPVHCPLIIALHGGGYDHQYFDATPKTSATVASTAFGVPFVSVDRPSYGGTSSVLPIPDNSTFHEQSGDLLHRQIIPEIWRKIGIPNNCNCVVLLCHSFGVMPGMVTAAMHAKDEKPSYPLGGMIASGLGNEQPSHTRDSPSPYLQTDDEHYQFKVDAKDGIMFKQGTCDPEILKQSPRLNAIFPVAEVADFASSWLTSWKETWAIHVTVPVMFSLVDDDPFFVVNEEELQICINAFENSVRVDGSLIKGAPHCVELSHWSQGWYARCFGFAMECATSLASFS